MSTATDFKPARILQRRIQEDDPYTDQYAVDINQYTAFEASARRANPTYDGCIHGAPARDKACPVDAVMLCDWCRENTED